MRCISVFLLSLVSIDILLLSREYSSAEKSQGYHRIAYHITALSQQKHQHVRRGKRRCLRNPSVGIQHGISKERYTQSRSPKKVRTHPRERDAKTRRYSTMTPFLLNVTIFAVVALKVLAALLILNWIEGE